MPEAEKDEPFETVSYISRIAGEFGMDNERPPRSAKLVASLSWAWGPAHNRFSTYLLCSDRQRHWWCLWEKSNDPNTGKLVYREVAAGTPYRNIKAEDAAEQLLAAAWQGEIEFEYAELQGVYVEEE